MCRVCCGAPMHQRDIPSRLQSRRTARLSRPPACGATCEAGILAGPLDGVQSDIDAFEITRWLKRPGVFRVEYKRMLPEAGESDSNGRNVSNVARLRNGRVKWRQSLVGNPYRPLHRANRTLRTSRRRSHPRFGLRSCGKPPGAASYCRHA